MTPFVQDADFTLYVGDVRDCLRELPAESVHTCVTSPPYFGLRDYSADGQIGLEATLNDYVAVMVDVFREARRVLRHDATLWLNLGDSYAANRSYQVSDQKHLAHDYGESNATKVPDGLKPKDLMGVPWRVAFALQADGWYLRSDIIWAKPNPMPESVTDRPTKAHEYVFLLSKSPRYFFDQEAVREPHVDGGAWIGRAPVVTLKANGDRNDEGAMPTTANPAGRNLRSVWAIATQPYPEAHFATFPEALPERCIKAGTSEQGCCPECGAAWVRVLEKQATGRVRQRATGGLGTEIRRESHGLAAVAGVFQEGVVYNTTGWQPSCGCAERGTDASASIADAAECRTRGPAAGGLANGTRVGGSDDGGGVGASAAASGQSAPALADLTPVPCTVLDPFMGSGTTALVARRLGRKSIGIELNPEYAELCARRLQQQSLFAGDAA